VANLRVAWSDGDRPPVFDAFDLSVDAGSFVSLVGASGCGKSTLLRVLAGLVVPSSGTATVGGRSVLGQPGTCAWLPQRDALLPWRSVLANATLGIEVAGGDRQAAERDARALLARFGLAEVADAWPHELSGGMRQRVAVLRAVLTPAPLLLLDEPFGALDALTRRDLQGWLRQVLADPAVGTRRTVLLVTHDVEEAVLLSDRVVVLAGRPAHRAADHTVDLPADRHPDLVLEPSFVAQRRLVLDALAAPR
jgi:ABC-type nitrate/sulfonate/bicarbonate transport system ATPase subunit